jgi:hypothetical protein
MVFDGKAPRKGIDAVLEAAERQGGTNAYDHTMKHPTERIIGITFAEDMAARCVGAVAILWGAKEINFFEREDDE